MAESGPACYSRNWRLFWVPAERDALTGTPMPLFRSSAVADFSNRNLDAGVAQAVQQLGRTARTLVGGARLGVCVFDLNSSATDPPYGGVNDGADFFVA